MYHSNSLLYINFVQSPVFTHFLMWYWYSSVILAITKQEPDDCVTNIFCVKCFMTRRMEDGDFWIKSNLNQTEAWVMSTSAEGI